MTYRKDNAGTAASKVVFDNLETWLREKLQGFIQDILEQEVTELLGRGKSERKPAIEAMVGYRNGYGKERKLSTSIGTVAVRRPRLRNLEEKFESRVLPLFVRHTGEVASLLPELYLHGLAQGDFELALRGLLGDGAPLSESSIARLKEKWQAEYEAWQSQSLAELEVVYLWVDGIYVKAGLEKEKACLLVALAALSDGRKVFVGMQAGQRESIQSWSSLLRSLRERGLSAPKIVIGDGNLGIWGGLRNVYPQAQEQRCWNHRVLNLLDRISKKLQSSAKLMLKNIPLAETKAECEKRKMQFQTWCRQHSCHEAAELIEQDWERMITFYQFPKEHWKHLRTSNPIESPFAVVRLRTDAAKRFKKVANASAMIWKMMLVAEKKFRRLNSPDLLIDVFNGTAYLNGKRVKTKAEQEIAA